MTVDEIKRQHSMREIVEQYGLRINRAGFCSCPFHKGDRTASMKIYSDSFHCFGCGMNGDIFTFIQRMDNCDFKTAFYQLGGSYQKPSSASTLALYRAKAAREKREQEKRELERKIKHNNLLINVYVKWIRRFKPYSDEWCDIRNALDKCLVIDEYLTKELEGK